MEVPVGAVIHEKARVMRHLQVGVERRQKRVVEGGENLRLRLNVGEFLRVQRVAVDDFEGEVGVVIVAETAQEDAAEIACADEAEELEMAEVEGTVGGECGGGIYGGPVGVVVAAVGAVVDVGDGGGGSGGGGGEAGLVEAECEAAPG